MKNLKLLSIVVFLILGLSVQAAKETFTSTFEKEFEVNKDASLKINNSFGDIQCYNWDENKVKIEVLIEVTAEDKRDADRVFDRISVEISGDRSLVEVRTRINNIKSRNMKFRVNVNVYFPESLDLDFTNRFGNMFLGVVKGKTKLSQSFGTLEIKELQGDDNEIMVQHGSLNAEDINEAVIDIRHSEMNLENNSSLNIDAQFTSMLIENVDLLKVDANFGSLEIDRAKSIQGDFNGTSIEIDDLMELIDVNMQLGDISIDRVSRNFTEVDIDGKHASISLALESGSSFSFDLETKFASVYLPSEFKMSKEKLGFNTYRYQGTFGNASSQSLIKIESEFGTVEIN